MSRVLVCGDIHAPVTHPGYLSFCWDLFNRHRCNSVVLIGDVVDWHNISFHSRHPDAPGPSEEYARAMAAVAGWVEIFPHARVCIGNHDERLVRLAETVNIPAQLVKTLKETWGTGRWKWEYDFIIDNVYYFHGTGCSGIHPAYNAMKKMLMSVVMGHCHSAAGIKWAANPLRRIFGMDVGCGIDDKKYAFNYGQYTKTRSILGAGVVLDGVPYHEICPIGPREKYWKGRFKTRG